MSEQRVHVQFMEVMNQAAMEHQQQVLTEMAKRDDVCKSFPNLWTRWGNWDVHVPMIATVDDEVAGFHAAAFGVRDPKYINLYYQLVLPEFRRKGVSRKLVEFMLQQGMTRGCQRLKLKVLHERDGHCFWRSLGMIPFGTDGKHYLYDIDLRNVQSDDSREEIVSALRGEAEARCLSVPDHLVKRYTRMGVRMLTAAERKGL